MTRAVRYLRAIPGFTAGYVTGGLATGICVLLAVIGINAFQILLGMIP